MTRQRDLQTVLVANRGEIAVRLFRACSELGLRSVAAYSDPDAGSEWSRQANLSVRLPGSTAADTYLNVDAVLAAARQVGADAIHPGYGFLSESAEFAEACAADGLVFIGPTPEAMRVLGSKSKARQVAAIAGVPVTPGADGLGRSDAELAESAAGIGYPIVLKASEGGGGRGMRLVADAGAFDDALAAVRAESAAAFGSVHLLVEKRLADVRHVEVQVLGDNHGHLVHLFERECSIQRRNQKLVEEAPSPGVDEALRRELTEAALAIARTVNYNSSGTVEFLVDGSGRYYFLEMNTRLQVEHPVTEAVTGVDLAVWQIRVAAGQPLAFGQDDLSLRGHAIECRLYAEDPARDFLPSTGTIEVYRAPGGPGVRCDDGVAAGHVVSPYYDALLAKVIASGWDRAEALHRMRHALSETVLLGITTNLRHLQDIVDHEAFESGRTNTTFLAEHMAGWRPRSDPSEEEWLAIAAFESLAPADSPSNGAPAASGLVADPWAMASAWRNVP